MNYNSETETKNQVIVSTNNQAKTVLLYIILVFTLYASLTLFS